MTIARSLVFCWSLFVAVTSVRAFPIEPVSLRTLIERSDLIVHGKVLNVRGDHTKQIEEMETELATTDPRLREFKESHIELLKRMGPMTGIATAKIGVLDILKGKIGPEVSIQYHAGLTCPAPPRFPLGTNLILFLKSDGRGNLETVGLSYGAVEVSPEQAQIFRHRVTEYLEIISESDPAKKSARTVDWLVSVAEDPLTRWDGAAELVERKTFRGQKISAPLGEMLTTNHLLKLKSAVLQSTTMNGGDRAILKLVSKDDPLTVARHVIAYLERAKQPGPPAEESRDSFVDPWDIYDSLFFLAELGDDTDRFKQVMNGTLRTAFMDGAQQRVTLTSKFLPEAMRGVQKQPWWVPQ